MSTFYTMNEMVDVQIFSYTSDTSGHEYEYLFDMNPDTYWQASSTSTQTFDIDLGNSLQPDAIYVFIKNYEDITSLGMDRYFSDNAIAWTFVSGSPSLVDQTQPHRLDAISVGASHRFWRLSFTGANVAVEASMIALVKENALTFSHTFPKTDKRIYSSQTFKSAGGREFKHLINKSKTETFQRQYKFIPEADKDLIIDTFDESYGSVVPLILQEGTTEADVKLVRFANDSLSIIETAHQLYNVTVSFDTLPYITAGDLY